MTRAMTMDEAAKALRKSRRWLHDWLAKNPVDAAGRPFCSKLGRTRLFRETDITRILDAALDKSCRSNSSRRERGNHRTGRSGGAISESLWTEAQKLLGKPLPNENLANSKKTSNVVRIRQSGQRQTPPHS